MNNATHQPSTAKRDPAVLNLRSSLLDDLRQWWFPAEFRIAAPRIMSEGLESAEPDNASSVNESDISDRLVAEVATSLWDTERKLRPAEGEEPERKHRLAYRRVMKAIDALKDNGVEIKDPTGERYPQGGENWMKPIQLQPTPGLTFERVSETVAPIIYRNERLIQRGEVFVAVPEEPSVAAADQAAETENVTETDSAETSDDITAQVTETSHEDETAPTTKDTN